MRVVKFSTILLYVLGLTFISWYINGKSLVGIDDANIYLVYMKNFANGHGFVYNIGGEKVEGFTSMLWTLIGSLFFLISNHSEIFLLIINIILISYILYDVCNYIDKENEIEYLLFSYKSYFFLALVGITPGFIDWTVLSLMETGLWCFLITLISLKIIRYDFKDDKFKHNSILSLLFILLMFCRPESMLLVPFFIFLNSIKEYFTSKSIRKVFVWTLISSTIFITSLLLFLYWRLYYFGYPLPNTYYAKVSSSFLDNLASGEKYLYHLFYEKPFIILIFSISVYIIFKLIIKKKLITQFTFFVLFSIMCISFIIPLYSGGDHFELHRFIMPFIPIIILLGIEILKELNFLINKYNLILLFFVIFFSNDYNFKYFLYHKSYPLRLEWDIAVMGRRQSNKLNIFFKLNKKLPSQGVYVAGGSAYFYNGESIDLLGLNNTKMAHADKIKDKNLPKNHASFNSDVFFELSPDLFWYENCGFVNNNDSLPKEIKINPKGFASRIFKNIHLDKRFANSYGFFRIDYIYNKNEALQIFANNKFVSSLDTSIYKITTIKYE